MKRWQDFLDSLSTRGGNILLLFIATGLLLFAFFHAVHHTLDTSVIETLKALVSGFAGALLALLSAQSSRQQMQDRIEVVPQGARPLRDVDLVHNEQPPTKQGDK